MILSEQKYRKIKADKAQEIVTLLDLFDGKLTLTDILDTDMSLINQLRDAKIEIRKMQELRRQQSSPTTVVDPATLSKR